LGRENSLNNIFIKLMEKCAKENRQISFEAILDKTNLPSEVVEKALLDCFQSGAAGGVLELRCPQCGKDLGEYKRLSEVPEKTICQICDTEVPRSFDYVELIVQPKTDHFFRTHKRSACEHVETCQR